MSKYKPKGWKSKYQERLRVKKEKTKRIIKFEGEKLTIYKSYLSQKYRKNLKKKYYGDLKGLDYIFKEGKAKVAFLTFTVAREFLNEELLHLNSINFQNVLLSQVRKLFRKEFESKRAYYLIYSDIGSSLNLHFHCYIVVSSKFSESLGEKVKKLIKWWKREYGIVHLSGIDEYRGANLSFAYFLRHFKKKQWVFEKLSVFKEFRFFTRYIVASQIRKLLEANGVYAEYQADKVRYRRSKRIGDRGRINLLARYFRRSASLCLYGKAPKGKRGEVIITTRVLCLGRGPPLNLLKRLMIELYR